MKSYSEKLKSPKWQKKRLEVLSRDNFTCVKCKDTETELHVNHLKYTGEPYDAPLSDLETLCKNCHAIHHALPDFNITRVLKEKNALKQTIYCIECKRSGFGRVYYIFANIMHDGKVDTMTDYTIVHQRNQNLQMKEQYKISVDFKNNPFSFYDFGGVDKFAKDIQNSIASKTYRRSKQVFITRTSNDNYLEIFSVKKINDIFYLEHIGGAS